MRVLAGDIGGTKTLLVIAEIRGNRIRTVREQRFDSTAYPSFSAIVEHFLKGEKSRSIRSACFGIAGPIQETPKDQYVKVTNLPWQINASVLKRRLKISRLRLINDFQAVGYGIESLKPKDIVTLQKGKGVPGGPRAVLGAGTGLGQGILIWSGDRYEPVATEGGHANFAPTDELQIELARYLLNTAGRSSWELVLSGHGLVELYRFLKSRGDVQESEDISRALYGDDPAAAITRAAMEQGDTLANKALELFIDIYGAQAGNVALTAGATNGVYIAGGIAPKILPRLTDNRFLGAFLNKGKMQHYVAAIPVHVITNPQVGLMGAIRAAVRLLK